MKMNLGLLVLVIALVTPAISQPSQDCGWEKVIELVCIPEQKQNDIPSIEQSEALIETLFKSKPMCALGQEEKLGQAVDVAYGKVGNNTSAEKLAAALDWPNTFIVGLPIQYKGEKQRNEAPQKAIVTVSTDKENKYIYINNVNLPPGSGPDQVRFERDAVISPEGKFIPRDRVIVSSIEKLS